MRFRLFVVLALACFPAALRADTVTGTVSGVISILGPGPYRDTYGLFGPVGGILTGDTVSVTYTYNTADFQSPINCGTNCQRYFSTDVVPAQSLSVTVNGQTKAYTQYYYSELQFQNAYYYNPGNYLTYSVDAGYYSGAYLKLYSPDTSVTFGQSVTSYSNGGDLNFYGPAGIEAFQFSTSTPSPAPEPSSIILVGTGLLGMAGVMGAASSQNPSRLRNSGQSDHDCRTSVE